MHNRFQFSPKTTTKLHYFMTNLIFDVQTTFGDLAQAHDQPGILKSRDYFNSLIKAEIEKGIPSSRIILGTPDLPSVQDSCF